MKLSEKDALDIAWKYFQQHAQQRVSYFNFFILFSSILTTGLIATLSPQFNLHVLGTGIGLMEVLIAYVFIKIDDRNRYLTKIGEDALRTLELLYDIPDNSEAETIRVFNKEVKQTASLKSSGKWHSVLTRQISHSKSFRIIYLGFAAAGLVGVVVSLREAKPTTSGNKSTNSKVYFGYSTTKRALGGTDPKKFR